MERMHIIRAPLGAALMTGLALCVSGPVAAQQNGASEGYDNLLALFEDWRAFETPDMTGGAPDYSDDAITEKETGLETYRARLEAIDPSGWPTPQQVDYQIVRAEMNGLDFNIRVLQPGRATQPITSPSGPMKATRRRMRGRPTTLSLIHISEPTRPY